jgi:hypothetical protein
VTLLAAAGIASVIVAAPSRAYAEPTMPSVANEDPAYRRLIDEALAEFDAGHFDEALTLFEQAYALRPSARVLRGVAKTLFELRAYLRSVATINAALGSDVDPLPESLRVELVELRARALRFVGRVVLTVQPRDARVVIDGRPREDASSDIVLEAGRHRVDVEAAGHHPAQRTFDVTGGESVSLDIALTPARSTVVVEHRSGPVFSPVTLALLGGALGVSGLIGSSLWFVDRRSAVDMCVAAAARGARCENAEAVAFQHDAAAVTIGLSAIATLASGVGLFIALRTPPEAQRTGLACSARGASLLCGATRSF